jgi:hypothetical protein
LVNLSIGKSCAWYNNSELDRADEKVQAGDVEFVFLDSELAAMPRLTPARLLSFGIDIVSWK